MQNHTNEWAGLFAEPLLDRESEVDLALKIRRGSEVADLVAAQERLPTLEEAQVIQVGESARDQFLRANLRLVKASIHKYRVPACSTYEDMFQEGVIGLTSAVAKFDPDKGFKFSTYATHWIHQAVSRFIERNQTPVTVSAERSRAAFLKRAEGQELGVLDVQVLAARSPARVQPTSHQNDPSEGGVESIVEGLSSGEDIANDIVESMGRDHVSQCVSDYLATLSDLDRHIVRSHFGFDGEPQTLAALGRELDTNAEYVRRRLKRALHEVPADFLTLHAELAA